MAQKHRIPVSSRLGSHLETLGKNLSHVFQVVGRIQFFFEDVISPYFFMAVTHRFSPHLSHTYMSLLLAFYIL